MGSVIVRLTDEREWWLEWSSVVDAPVTYGMSEEQFIAYYTRSYGTRAGRELPARMERARATGTSMIGETLAELIAYNRAGPRESTLTLAEIVAAYCTGPREEESASSSNDVVSTSPEVVEAARTTGDDSGATAERGLVAPSDTVNVPRELLVKLLVFVRDGGKQSGVGPKRIQSLRHQDIAAVERLLEVKRG